MGLAVGGLSAQPAPAAPTQWAADSATVKLAAGPQYARGGVWQFFWGRHYRAIWATPVTAPVLRLATAVPGGLVPLQMGGSYQSRTLRLQDTTGAQYMLRSVDKDASSALPAGWLRRALGGLMKDQTSAGLPYGAYVAARLAEAAGVYHTNPRLVYLPNDPALGQFGRSYAHALYLLEERPEGNRQQQASFGYSPAVVNTSHLLSRLRRAPSQQVDARAYLRARLLDIWLGDWSRREDQWRWASFRAATGAVRYRPIPRDRDQAFFLFDDGLITRLVAWFVPKYHSFHATIPLHTVGGLTTTARALDRTLLATLSADDFRQEADSLRRRLTDAAIAHALAAGPAETQAAIAARLGPVLRARRAQLPAVAAQYYHLLARQAWVVGTDQPERFVLQPTGAGQLRVQVLARRPGQPDSLISERTYRQPDTEEIELYGLGGDDVFELRGPVPRGFHVTVFDGDGHDHLMVPAGGAAQGRITWLTTADSRPAAAPAGISIRPDPHPELTANALAWLKRYRLDD